MYHLFFITRYVQEEVYVECVWIIVCFFSGAALKLYVFDEEKNQSKELHAHA